MARDLARRGESTVAKGGPDAGHGADIDAVDFDGRAVDYDELPNAFRATAAAVARREQPGQTVAPRTQQPSPTTGKQPPRSAVEHVIASSVCELDKPRRVDGRVVQRRVGWQATPTAIVFTTADRELARTDSGAYRPNGPWLIEQRTTYRNREGMAQKRSGNVPANTDDASTTPNNPAGGSSNPSQAKDEREWDATKALSYLPATVRRSIVARVEQPTVFDGRALGFSDNTGSLYCYTVDLVRMDNQTAVVVQAERKLNSHEWSVTQATYTLGAPQTEQG